MTDKQVRLWCRLIVASLATAKLADWISAALPLEGWPYAIVMTAAVMLVWIMIVGTISDGPLSP